MHDELKTIDDVMEWLEINEYIKFDDKGPYVTHAKYKCLSHENRFLTGRDKMEVMLDLQNQVYRGPPMRLDAMEYAPSKVYIDISRLEGMISDFLIKGEAEAEMPLSIKMDNGRNMMGNRYSNHTTTDIGPDDPDQPIYYTDHWLFEGDLKIKMSKNKTGDVGYDAEIIKMRFIDGYPKITYELPEHDEHQWSKG